MESDLQWDKVRVVWRALRGEVLGAERAGELQGLIWSAEALVRKPGFH